MCPAAETQDYEHTQKGTDEKMETIKTEQKKEETAGKDTFTIKKEIKQNTKKSKSKEHH